MKYPKGTKFVYYDNSYFQMGADGVVLDAFYKRAGLSVAQVLRDADRTVRYRGKVRPYITIVPSWNIQRIKEVITGE